MGDLISRQAAIDALHTILMYRMGTDSNKKRLDDWINSLPPIQPKRGEGFITAISAEIILTLTELMQDEEVQITVRTVAVGWTEVNNDR